MAKKEHSRRPGQELTRIWHKAWDEGIWLQFVDGITGYYMVAAGSLLELKRFGVKVEKWALLKIRQNKLKLGDCVALGAVPGVGKTPEDACRNAIRALKRNLKSKRRG